jgi:hypothetical protein
MEAQNDLFPFWRALNSKVCSATSAARRKTGRIKFRSRRIGSWTR